MLTELVQCVMKFEIELGVGPRLRTGIAPRVAGTIVGADPRKLLDFRLDQNPIKGKVAEAIFDYNRKSSLARAVDMKAMTAKVSQFAYRCRSQRGASGQWHVEHCGFQQKNGNDRYGPCIHASPSCRKQIQRDGTQHGPPTSKKLTS